MACVESAYVRRPLTYFSMTKCVFIGLLAFLRQTKPETELGSTWGGAPWWFHTCEDLRDGFQSYQRFGWLEKAQVTCTDDGDDVVFSRGELLITEKFCGASKCY